MGRRPLKTVPAGQPPPIFSTIRCNPSGVQFEPSLCPMPNREVQQGNCLTHSKSLTQRREDAELLAKSEVVCPAMLTARINCVGRIRLFWQAEIKFPSK